MQTLGLWCEPGVEGEPGGEGKSSDDSHYAGERGVCLFCTLGLGVNLLPRTHFSVCHTDTLW